ncbi:MAG TPA: FecR domain-containing protein [Chitinophagaceae bacterium]|nr:FecR domain-containing protein [Chitinophagaceae bacterium]
MKNTSRISELVLKFLQEELSPEEQMELEDWRQDPENAVLFRELITPEHLHNGIKSVYGVEQSKERIYNRVLAEMPARKGRSAQRFQRIYRLYHDRWAAAVAALLLIAGGGYMWIHFKSAQRAIHPAVKLVRDDIPPGGNKAVLTLGNGARIILDSARTGQLASQGNTKIIKAGSGLLTYHPLPAGPSPAPVTYNTLTTPKGGQYQLVLPDGTKVWLNAASSIRYPTSFTGKVRTVETTGETYFEVAHNQEKPFKVKIGNAVVRDLGTHFNINAYTNEPLMKITLLEGSVSVSRNDREAERETGNMALLPGQQAQISRQGGIDIVSNVNVEKEIAWKNGLFYFREIGVHELMKRLERWYDIQVEYVAGYHNTYHFTGEISRNVPISRVLEMVEQTGVAKFNITGKTVTVMPGIPIPSP